MSGFNNNFKPCGMPLTSDKKDATDLSDTRNDDNNNRNNLSLHSQTNKRRFGLTISLLRYFAGPIVSILAFFASNDFSTHLKDGDMTPLLWAVICYVVALHVEQFITEHTTKEDNSHLVQALQSVIQTGQDSTKIQLSSFSSELVSLMSNLNVSIVSESSCMERIAASVESARYVRNTFVNLYNITGTHTMASDILIKRYERFLKKGREAEWHDVVGLGDFFDGRYHKIFPSGETTDLCNHRLYILNGQAPIPVMNFMLCADQSRDFTELYFGWIAGSAKSFDVYHTRDKRIISFFSAYFDQIIDSKRVIEFDIPYQLRPDQRFSTLIVSRMVGKWLSVSRSEKDKNKSDSIDYAIIDISYDNQWKLSGKIFRHTSAGEELKYIIDSQTCALIKHTLYYSYLSKDKFHTTNGEGVGGYSISEAPGELSLHGFFSHLRTGKKHETFATKVTEEEINKDNIYGIIEKMLGLGKHTASSKTAKKENPPPEPPHTPSDQPSSRI